ncbi:MAG: pitrilysin family protein [Polyangiales bacterium]
MRARPLAPALRLAASALLLEASSLVGVPSVHAAELGPFPKAPEITRLDNGLTVVTIPWASPGIVAYYTLVRVGARDEVEPGHSGFAHLFEHMMFRGTERFPEQVYEDTLQSFGADSNAYTTEDFTLYTITAPRSALARVAELEGDRFQHLSFDERQYRTETGAVLGEYNKSASSPSLKMWEALSELAFKSHTYRHTTIGYLADVQAMPNEYAYAKAFFKRFYTPDNATVVVAGEVPHAENVALVKQHYGGWRGTRDQPTVPAEPEPTQGARRHLDWDGMSAPELLIGYRASAFAGPGQGKLDAARVRDAAALDVVRALLFHPAAPLYQALVVERQQLLALDSYAKSWTRDPGLFVVNAELKDDGPGFEAIEREIQQAIDALARGEVNADRVAAVRSHLRYGLTLDVETASEAADTFAQFVAVSGSTDALEAYLGALGAVTAEDVARVAARYLTPQRRFVITLKAKPRGGTP